jgi:hypothetical protein
MGDNKMSEDKTRPDIFNPYKEEIEEARMNIKKAIENKDYAKIRKELDLLRVLYISTSTTYFSFITGLEETLKKMENKKIYSDSKSLLETLVTKTKERHEEIKESLSEIINLQKEYHFIDAKKEYNKKQIENDFATKFLENPYQEECQKVYDEYQTAKEKGDSKITAIKLKRTNMVMLNTVMYYGGIKTELENILNLGIGKKGYVFSRKVGKIKVTVNLSDEKQIRIFYNRIKTFSRLAQCALRNLPKE